MAIGDWNQVQAEQWREFVWRHLHYSEISAGCLAHAVGVPVDTVSGWFEGMEQLSVPDCLAIARILGASENRILELAGHSTSLTGGTFRDYAA